MGAEPLHSRDTSAFGRPSISRAHCSEGETGAPKPPSQSHVTKEERSQDLSRLPVTAPPAPQPLCRAPGPHDLAPAVGPHSGAHSHPVCSPNSTCSCPRSVPGHAPRPPAPAKAEAWSCLPRFLLVPSPRLRPIRGTDSICTPRTQHSEGALAPACHPHALAPADKGSLYPLGSGREERPTRRPSGVKAPVFVGSLPATVIWCPLYTRHVLRVECRGKAGWRPPLGHGGESLRFRGSGIFPRLAGPPTSHSQQTSVSADCVPGPAPCPAPEMPSLPESSGSRALQSSHLRHLTGGQGGRRGQVTAQSHNAGERGHPEPPGRGLHAGPRPLPGFHGPPPWGTAAGRDCVLIGAMSWGGRVSVWRCVAQPVGAPHCRLPSAGTGAWTGQGAPGRPGGLQASPIRLG